MKNKTGQSGLTLVELMIAISIIGIITAVGSTTLLQHLPTMRLKSASRDIFSTMMQAKTEAIRRGENVTILFNTPANGYIMFIGVFGAGETVLFTQPSLPNGITFAPVDLNNNGNFNNPGDVADADGISFANNTLIFSQRGIPIDATTGTPPLISIGAENIDQGVGIIARDTSGAILRQRTITVSSAGRFTIKMK